MVQQAFILPDSWRQILADEFGKPYFRDLLSKVESAYQSGVVFPPRDQIFRAFERCPPQEVKVVIIGQDPYHAAGQAHGLCFSVNPGVRIPPSLRNIYKELEQDVPGFTRPTSGDLSSWSDQGVLLLNAILTVSEGSPGSHKILGWEWFTDAVIQAVSRTQPAVVFLLWGNFAINKRSLINESRHLVLTAPHPSPLARGGFSGCRHFSRTNEWLSAQGLTPVNWQL